MDGILTSFLNFGIGGSITAAFLYFCYHILTKTIPDILTQHREELGRADNQHREDIKRMEERYERRDQAYLKAIETVCGRVENLNDNFVALQGNLVRGNCPVLAIPTASTNSTAITAVPKSH